MKHGFPWWVPRRAAGRERETLRKRRVCERWRICPVLATTCWIFRSSRLRSERAGSSASVVPRLSDTLTARTMKLCVSTAFVENVTPNIGARMIVSTITSHQTAAGYEDRFTVVESRLTSGCRIPPSLPSNGFRTDAPTWYSWGWPFSRAGPS